MNTDVIKVLAEHWDRIVPLLTGDQRDIVAGYAQRLLSVGDAQAQLDAARRIVQVVAPLLPAEHPVRRALAAESHRYAGSASDYAPSLAVLRTSLALGAATAGPGLADTDPEAEGWLLAAPAVDGDEVRRRGADPGSPALIRIGRSGQAPRWPAFQFDPAGQPYAVVAEINVLLDAEHDPWGAADWWLGRNAWLDVCPADLIGRGEDERLIAAARAVLWEG